MKYIYFLIHENHTTNQHEKDMLISGDFHPLVLGMQAIHPDPCGKG
jgi:hypothetical protein